MRVHPLHRPLAPLLAGLLLAGCAVGPDYVAPDADAPTGWNQAAEGVHAGPSEPDALARWWTALDDPVLTDLIGRASRGNLDLAQAKSRLVEARAQRGVSRADLFPGASASGGASRTRTGKGAGASIGSAYNAGFDASWELDLFGGNRRAVEAARADVEAGEADLNDVRVSLAAEVAANYVQLRALQARLGIARSNLKAQTDTFDLTRWRADAGLTTRLDVAQARLNLEQTRAQVPSLETQITQAKNRLAVLSGERPGALADLLEAPRPIPVAPADVAVGVPADALRARPDVRRAERQLAAQSARVGQARAARFPSLSLAGSIGLEALTAGNLFVADALVASERGSLGWTLFDAGRLKGNVKVQDARRDQALSAWHAAVLAALEDVEGALAAYSGERTRRDSLATAAGAARTAADLARDQYASGLIDFQQVLDAQRTLYALEDQLTQSRGAVTTDVIQLYKALGGGWTRLADAGAEADLPLQPIP